MLHFKVLSILYTKLLKNYLSGKCENYLLVTVNRSAMYRTSCIVFIAFIVTSKNERNVLT